MQGSINVAKIMAEAQRNAKQTTAWQPRRARQIDPDRLHEARKITARIHGVILRCQNHQLSQREAVALIHELESQL